MEASYDIIVQNPPYNPNSLWKPFVRKALDRLKDDGHLVVIHPDNWRWSSKHNKLFNELKNGLVELRIKQFSSFNGIMVSTDWYHYQKSGSEQCLITYADNHIEILNNSEIVRINKFSTNSIPGRILKKITKEDYNNGIIINQAFGTDRSLQNSPTGIYPQCGGSDKSNTSWCRGIFNMTDIPTPNQFEEKVVMAYVRKPRAQYFTKEQAVGVIRGNYWLTEGRDFDPNSLALFLNSDLMLVIGGSLMPQEDISTFKSFLGFYPWFLKSLNIEGLYAKNKEELYQHYGLTQEEIDFIEHAV